MKRRIYTALAGLCLLGILSVFIGGCQNESSSDSSHIIQPSNPAGAGGQPVRSGEAQHQDKKGD